jgi:hypothetical protein
VELNNNNNNDNSKPNVFSLEDKGSTATREISLSSNASQLAQHAAKGL